MMTIKLAQFQLVNKIVKMTILICTNNKVSYTCSQKKKECLQ
jgi:hypothetical protein